MPGAGLDAATVTRAAVEVVDEVGYASLTMGLVADRLGVRAPSLYKHVAGQADLSRRIAVLAVTEIGDALRNAMQGKSERQALEAAAPCDAAVRPGIPWSLRGDLVQHGDRS